MAETFMGEIRMVAFNFPPAGWAQCDGALMGIPQNQPLFSLLGTSYGGDGVSTFALPDFRSRGPIHQGEGPGLSDRSIGERGGQEAAEIQSTKAEIPKQPDNPTVIDFANGVASIGTMPPYLVVNFIINLNGTYPVR